MPVSLSVTSNSALVGFNIVASFDAGFPTGTGSVFRITSSTVTPVRGFVGVPYTPTYNLVDAEVGLDQEYRYLFVHTPSSGSPIFVFSDVLRLNDLTTAGGEFTLRNLFALNVDSAVVKNVKIGTLQDVAINIRSSEFSVLGRSDPVVIVDTVDSTRSTLMIETDTVADRERVKSLFVDGNPLVLQSKSSYDIGREGVLYFQPKKISIKRLTVFGQRPERRFEVEYAETRTPPSNIVFATPTSSYEDVDEAFATYSQIISETYSYYGLQYELG